MILALVIAAAVSASPTPVAANFGGAAAPPDGTYNYTISKGGDALGKSTVTIKRADVGVTIHETETMAGSLNFTIDEILDAATLAPKAYSGTYARSADAQTTARAAIDRNGAVITIDGVPGTAPLPNPRGIKNAYVLEGALMSGFALLPAQIHASKASQFSQILPRQVLQFVAHVDQHPAAIRPSSVPAGDALLSITGQVNFDEWYDPSTFVLHALTVPSQQVLITLTK